MRLSASQPASLSTEQYYRTYIALRYVTRKQVYAENYVKDDGLLSDARTLVLYLFVFKLATNLLL